MITGRDFIVLSDDWNGLPTSTMHLVRCLSKHNRVFWLNMVNRMPGLSWEDAKKAARMALRWGGRPTNVNGSSDENALDGSHGLHVTTPFMIPWFKPMIRRLNRRSLLHTFTDLTQRYDIENPILFTVFPPAADFVKAVSPALKIYYCYDDFLEYPGFNVADWRAMENELLGNTDALVVTSRDLERKNRNSCPTFYLPHGVDFEHFSQPTAEPVAVPPMEDIPRPIVGFFGLISEWVDLKLLVTLSKTFPDTSFVLIGKSEIDTSLLANCPNMHCLGLVPYKDLPQYAKYFDIALIPFVKSKLTEAVNPLKLMEYYALGLPVLATRLPELEGIGGPIHLASTEAEFCSTLREMLADDSCLNGTRAFETARRNTWEHRAEELSAFIESL